jgi:hypothetical protein
MRGSRILFGIISGYRNLRITEGNRTSAIFLRVLNAGRILTGTKMKIARRLMMRLRIFLAVLVLATMGQAKAPKHYQSGKLLRMESVKCGTDEKNGKSFAGEMIGTDSAHMKTHELLCQQYTLETSSLVYTVRPKNEKHPALLPIGENAQFRLEKDKMLLRVEDMDDKEREYIVISILPKGQPETAHNLTPGQ